MTQTSIPACLICGSVSKPFDRATVLARRSVQYYRCSACGFIQTETPDWLDEAYSSAMTSIDIGPLSRSIHFAHISRSLILMRFNRYARFLDFGGGYGLFVRRMRDLGFDYCLYDAHCENLFARGHQAALAPGERYELVTAFEVVEHLPDPMTVFERLHGLADNILFSTSLVPEGTPKIADWWYYGPEHGQHVSFFTADALRQVAQRLGLELYTAGSVHLLTPQKFAPTAFRWMINEHVAPTLGYTMSRLKRVKSLLPADFRALSGASIP